MKKITSLILALVLTFSLVALPPTAPLPKS